MGGLAAAVDLARAGLQVTVVERASGPGGKMRQIRVGGSGIDAGPTVFTMRWVFDALFEDAGAALDTALDLEPAHILARHAWRSGGRLDLFAEIERSADAIGEFAGADDAKGYVDFCRRSADVYRALCGPFIASQRPSPLELVRRLGRGGLGAMLRTSPMQSLWAALGRHFRDPRLRQLFGRYSTYCGSSPMQAPATLMLVAHVEQDGVWRVRGGMRRVAEAMRTLGESQGAQYRFDSHVREILVDKGRACGVLLEDGTRLEADAVVFNGDVSALPLGLLGPGVARAARGTAPSARSLSAVTWCMNTRTSGFPLSHHNVFFGEDYAAEFDEIFSRREITQAPTVYVCAQDRGDSDSPEGNERLLVLINAPADGDRTRFDDERRTQLQERTFGLLEACGLQVSPDNGRGVMTTPTEWEALFPASGGALYGRANHGPWASFQREGAASRVPGLYLAGGSVHPGPGIPMAAMSGRLAAARLLADSPAPHSA
jgi:1-hydroxycarotenoid 3,4-desaturase